MDKNTKKLCYLNFIHPYFIYGIHIYYSLSPNRLTEPLFLLQKKALRLICRDSVKRPFQKTLSTNIIAREANILPLPSLATYFTCLIGYNIFSGNCPPYLSALFATPQHRRSGRNQHKLPSSSAHNKLNLHVLKSFNSLPITLRNTTAINVKPKLKNHLLSLL